VLETNVSFVTWATLLGKLPQTAKRVDLLVLDQRDPGVAALVESFPLDLVKPSLLYYRTAAGAGTRRGHADLRRHCPPG
jgi:hypothetical protein